MTWAAYRSLDAVAAAAESCNLLRRWVNGEEEALIAWLDGRDGGPGRRLARAVRVEGRAVDLRRRLLEIQALRAVLLAGGRLRREGLRDLRRLRIPIHPFATRRGGARTTIPKATEVRPLFGAILALAVAYTVRAALDILALVVRPF